MELKNNPTLKEAIKVFGIKSQLLQCIEEMAELTQAINKYFRAEAKENTKTEYDQIIEETADVKIMLAQMELMFDGEAVEEMVERKIKRLEKRLNDYCN